jgi:hypothetical protein
MVVAPGRMIDSFLSIPDAESLPLYRMALKLACVFISISGDTDWTFGGTAFDTELLYRSFFR